MLPISGIVLYWFGHCWADSLCATVARACVSSMKVSAGVGTRSGDCEWQSGTRPEASGKHSRRCCEDKQSLVGRVVYVREKGIILRAESYSDLSYV